MRRSFGSVEGISLPAGFAPGTRSPTVEADTAEQGEEAVEYVFAAAEAEGAAEDDDRSGVLAPDRCPVAAWGAAGPVDSAHPAQARTATGVSRAVRASGRGRERTAHIS
ncbi:hypothetical protein GCM10023100_15080 [Actinocorallia cavernae]|uniref:Uncharacterized protein n=2 Tax=Actinomycetes TaxID=1760 RepID=A0ABP5XZF7_9ACTN